MMMSMYSQTIRRGISFKEELKNSIQRKLMELSNFPICITPELKREIDDLQTEFLELRQEKRFSINRGVEMQKEIDRIYNDLEKACSAPKPVKEEDDDEDRKRKPTSSKSKRKVCKCKKR